jgi:ubiquinone/menaquinone biosynthesis C-methylase UbiE
MLSHADTVQQQFDPQSRAYLHSAVHAAGPDLEHTARRIAGLPAGGAALDLGTGAGHLAFVLAGHFAQVCACDPSPAMLATVESAAAERGVAERIVTARASAEKLPYGSAAFDLVATRYSAHHWLDLSGALAEMSRVLRPGGALLVIDVLGDDVPLVDTHLQAMELLRDPGHVRNRSPADWHALLAASGFRAREERIFPLRLEFASWVTRMRTPPQAVDAIRRLQAGAPRQVTEALAFGEDGSFTVPTGWFWAERRVPDGS